MDGNTSFEKYPNSAETKAERNIPEEQDFAKSFEEGGVPEYAGDRFGIAKEENQFYGEATDEQESEESDINEGVIDAASIINYGLDAIAREKGVEYVVQGIKTFDASGSENPLRDLYTHLGLTDFKEIEDAHDEAAATKQLRNAFIDEYNMPKTQNRSREGALKAIADMKELIAEVEGADPRYAKLREGAELADKGYFEYAVNDYNERGLTELFATLNKQKEASLETNQSETEEGTESSTTGDVKIEDNL